MKSYLTLLVIVGIVLNLCSCSEKIQDYHAGIVVNEQGIPIDSALIYEDLAPNYLIKTYSDSSGYFKQRRQSLMDLIVAKEGYFTDTIRMVWHQSGETTEYAPHIKNDSTKIILRADTTMRSAIVILSFYSICCGTPKGDEILKYVKSFVKQHHLERVKIILVGGLGKEGEHDYVIEIPALTVIQKLTFLKNLNKLANVPSNHESDGGIRVTESRNGKEQYANDKRLTFKKIDLETW